MSSSNRVRLSAIAETTYGQTPGAGNFTEVRLTSEDLTGTPQVVESSEIRSDRQVSGQVNTGLELSGGFDFEASYDPSLRLFIEQAFMSDEAAQLQQTGVDLSISGVTGDTGTLTRALGDFGASGFANGDVVVLGGFANAANNVPVLLSNVGTTTCDITAIGLVDEAGTGDETITRPVYHEIGTTAKSVSLSKEFLDVDDGNVRNIAYRGMRVSEFSMNFAFGAIVTGRVGLAGNGYELPTQPITNARVVDGTTSDLALDASNGFGWLLVDGGDIGICLESFDFSLNNNLIPQNCVGLLAPQDQVLGSATVNFNATMHLGINSWDKFMAAKIAQTPISIAFYALDDQGQGYAVTMERVQVNFPDPATGGRDQLVTLQTSGVASYDDVSQRTMRIYKIG